MDERDEWVSDLTSSLLLWILAVAVGSAGYNELLELQEYRIVHVVSGIPIPGEVSMALSFVAAAVLTFLGFADLFITVLCKKPIQMEFSRVRSENVLQIRIPVESSKSPIWSIQLHGLVHPGTDFFHAHLSHSNWTDD